VILLLSTALTVAQPAGPSRVRRTLHTIRDVFALTSAEAGKAYPVELDAIVTYSDPEWGQLFVRDSTGTTYIEAHGAATAYPTGSHIRITAITIAGIRGPAIAHPKIVVLGQGVAPRPIETTVDQLDAGMNESHLVVTEGVLHPCDVDWTRVCFRLLDGRKLVWLAIREPDSAAARGLVGATVRVSGMAAEHVDAAGKRLAAQLLVDSLKRITVLAPPLQVSDPASLIKDLRSEDADRSLVRQVHVRGTVTWASAHLFSIQDSSGTLLVGTLKRGTARTGDKVDVIGFPSRGEFGFQLSDSDAQLDTVQSHAVAIAPLRVTAAEAIKRSLNGRRVVVQARLIAQSSNASEFVYDLSDGRQRFKAVLLRGETTRETVGLSPGAILELTGVALIQPGTDAGHRSLLVLIESPSDVAIDQQLAWLTWRRAMAIFGGMALCLIAPFVWIKQLRRTVRKQTSIHRAQLENEFKLATRFQRLFEHNLAAVYTWRPDGKILECNAAFVRLLGFQTREELIGRSYWDFTCNHGRREQLEAALENGALSSYETTLCRVDGVQVHILKNITPVETAEGTVYETTAIDVTQLRQNQAELQKAKDAAVHDSLNDPLTHLPNRRFLWDSLPIHLARASIQRAKAALLFIDLDGFKLVNDTLGHSFGDELLVQVAGCLRSLVRKEDTLARLGGDEFMVIMERANAKEEAARFAEELHKAFENPFSVRGHSLSISASIGISIYPENGIDPEELMQRADNAMYAAKREGKNQVAFFSAEMGTLLQERTVLQNLLMGAIARNEIFVHYQPQFDIGNQHLVRFEALARWTHPVLGQIPPAKFIPLAEESGIIGSLGAHIMEQACFEAARWQNEIPLPIQIAVNVSAIQLRHNGFVEEVSAILERTGLRPSLLQIELTESTMLGVSESEAQAMDRIRNLGIGLAIDDFGTGYSNLSYLPLLPFDYLKIDSSFVRNLTLKAGSETMIRTLISLAHDLGMRVIVEGVEEAEQLELIKTFEADEAQGFLLGRPSPDPMQVILNSICV
jgi:diguanylate cyclase (GGDEF)-like protein/PAS domain S-box-containing protein